MMIELSKWSYCPVLDEMLKFYFSFQATIPPVGVDFNKYVSQKFLENSKSSLDDILKYRGEYFTSGDFEFDNHISTNTILRFVLSFEKFVHRIIEEVKYILGL